MGRIEGIENYQSILAWLGILLFLVLLFGLGYRIVKNQPVKYLILAFAFPIVMIGFPGIKKVEYQGVSIEFKESLSAAEQNPDDLQAQENLARAIDRLKRYPNLKASTQLTLSEAHAQRGNKEEAQKYLRTTLRRNPSLEQKESQRISKLRAKIRPKVHP